MSAPAWLALLASLPAGEGECHCALMTGAVSDLVATANGHRQESLGARVEPDGRMEGTRWLTEGDRHTPRPLTEAERSGLRALAGALWERCSARGADSREPGSSGTSGVGGHG